MSTQEEKEKQQRELDNEKYKRDKQLAILKASNQMLEEAKESIREKWSDDPIQLNKLLNDVDKAKLENYQIGEKHLKAGSEEINGANFGKVSKVWIDKYNNHLRTIGMTDEQMRRKSIDGEDENAAKVVASSDSKQKDKKKWFSFSKKKDVDENISAEDFNTNKRTVKGDGYVETDEKIEEKEVIKEEKVDESNALIEKKIGIAGRTENIEYPEFDPSTLNPLTRFDIIELPSKGECYASKKGRIPVRELTAADENLIASPNMYANGQLIETILRRCILDKNFSVEDMCAGDRDAVVLWLRATAFGPEYKISGINPTNGKKYDATINLGDFKYKEFNLKGDENGCFDYTFENGDVAKFKILSFKENQEVQEEIALQYIDNKKYIVHQRISEIKRQVDEIFKQELADETLNDAIDYIEEWSDKIDAEGFENNAYGEFVTRSMVKRTVSINGNTDRKYIEEYVGNMRMSDAKKYREYMFENSPGVDFSFEVQIPESDGGGSVSSFLAYDDTIFLE